MAKYFGGSRSPDDSLSSGNDKVSRGIIFKDVGDPSVPDRIPRVSLLLICPVV